MNTPHRATPADWMRAALLALVPILAGLVGLNTLGSHHGDETAYIDVAIHMVESGNYLVPVFHGQLLLDKPPLYYWLVALSFHLFGISLFAARLPSLLGAGLMAASVYWFALQLHGNVRGAVYAALAVASSVLTCWISRLAVPDTIMTVGAVLALVFYHRATLSEHRAGNLLCASLGVGIAGMAKGHVGIVVATLPLAVVVMLVDRRSPYALAWRDLIAPQTWLPAAVLSGWWYVFLLVSQQPVTDFAPSHLVPGQTLRSALVEFMRAEVAHQTESSAPLWQNLSVYSRGFFVWFVPWSACILAGLRMRPQPFWIDWGERRRETLIPLSVIVSILLLFTAVILERYSARYLLPIAPPVGILAARFFVHREAVRSRRRPSTAVLVSTGLLLLYATFFGVLLPDAVRPPLESACNVLEPRLGPSDIVVGIDLSEKWATFAVALLGRPIDVIDRQGDIGSLVGKIDRLHAERENGKGAAYVVTPAETARDLQAYDGARFQLLDAGIPGWAGQRWELWEHRSRIVLLQVAAAQREFDGLQQPHGL
jgi:4-amino-4-deoxy-L-arabinose transferase-like glycosyltransferase